MKIFFEKFAKWSILASFFTPLFFFPGLWNNFIFPFIVPKILFFRSATLLLLGAYIILLLIDPKKYSIKNTPLTLGVLAFLLSFVVSTFLGVDSYRSFWDNHERMLGLFTFAHYVLWYLMVTTVVRSKEEWMSLWRWFLAIGSVVMLIGVVQKINPEAFLNQNNARVSGTLGNAIYFAGFGLFLGFAGLMLFLQEKKRLWRNTYLSLGLLGFGGIFLSSTRGTLLGLFVGIFVSVLLYFFFSEMKKENKKKLLGLLGGGVIILGILFVFRSSSVIQSIPALGRLLNSYSEITEKSPRLMAWGIAVESWKERPFFGWGPNNFYYAFNKYYRPEFLNFGYGETWFDNAHNVLLNTISVQGMVGLILYLALFFFASRTLFQKYREGKIGKHVGILGIGFLCAHFVHNIFVFENPTSYLTFFFFLAFVNGIDTPEKILEEKKDKSKIPGWKVVLVFGSIFLFLSHTNVKPGQANMSTFTTLQSLYTGQNILQNYEKTMSIPTPHVDDVRNDVARTVVSVLPEYAKANRLKDIEPLFDKAYEDMKKNLMLHPSDVRIAMQIGQMAQVGAQLFGRPLLLSEAEQALSQALKASPKRQQIQYMLSIVSLQIGNVEKSEQLLVSSISNNPEISEGWWRLAALYAQTGRTDKAVQTLSEAETQNIKIPLDKKELILKLVNPESVTSTPAE